MFVFEKNVSEFKDVRLDFEVNLRIVNSITDVKSLVAQRENWYHDWAKKRFNDGNICFGVEYNGEIISCIWTCFNEVYLPNVDYNLKVGNNIAPVLDGWTSPQYRNKGLYSYVMNSCLRYLHEKTDYTHAYFFIQPENVRSLLIHKELKVVFSVRLLKLFPFKFRRVNQLNCNISELVKV
jgi:RimJ/RimL family protein N-acetyltransferase